MVHFIKVQREDVPAKCMEVLFSISRIYPSPIGIVDGLNMDKLFISEQSIPPSITTTATVTAGNHLATIANTMSTAVSGARLTSKAAANHANASRDETIDFKDIPTNLQARYALKKHQVDIFRKSDLALYNNVLTTDKHGTIQDWRMIEYPEIGNGNTTKHDAQTYLCMLDGSIFGHLDYQNNKHKSAFLAGAPHMIEWTPKGFYHMCLTMEKAGAINRVWIHPFLCQRRDSESKWGFTCANQNDDVDADLPIKYQPKVNGWGVQIMAYLRKVLPTEAKSLLDICGTDGHQALQQLHLKFNPIHFQHQTDQCDKVPVQDNQTIEEYTSWYKWFQINKALVLDEKFDIGNVLTQDMCISNMKRYNEVRSIVSLEWKSPDQYIADQYKKDNFFNSIIALYNGLERTSPGHARSFRGQSQSNAHSVTQDNNKYDDWSSPEEYEFCRPGADPDFNSYESLMSLAYGDCGVNSLAYGDKHA